MSKLINTVRGCLIALKYSLKDDILNKRNDNAIVNDTIIESASQDLSKILLSAQKRQEGDLLRKLVGLRALYEDPLRWNVTIDKLLEDIDDLLLHCEPLEPTCSNCDCSESARH